MKTVLGMTPRNTGRCLAAAPALPSNAEPPQPTTMCLTCWAEQQGSARMWRKPG